MPLTMGLNDQIMALSAIRYCLGRHSYVVPAAIEWIQSEWNSFAPTTQSNICLDIVMHLVRCNNTAELPEDCAAWKAIGKWVFEKLNQDGKDWVRRYVDNCGEWPL